MPHILIIDEQADIRHLLERIVRRAGYTAQSAATIAQVGAYVLQQPPDLVLFDFVLRDGPFWHVLALLRAQLPARCPPLIVMSTSAQFECEHQADAGYLGFIHKPFLMRHLIMSIEGGLAVSQPCATGSGT